LSNCDSSRPVFPPDPTLRGSLVCSTLLLLLDITLIEPIVVKERWNYHVTAPDDAWPASQAMSLLMPSLSDGGFTSSGSSDGGTDAFSDILHLADDLADVSLAQNEEPRGRPSLTVPNNRADLSSPPFSTYDGSQTIPSSPHRSTPACAPCVSSLAGYEAVQMMEGCGQTSISGSTSDGAVVDVPLASLLSPVDLIGEGRHQRQQRHARASRTSSPYSRSRAPSPSSYSAIPPFEQHESLNDWRQNLFTADRNRIQWWRPHSTRATPEGYLQMWDNEAASSELQYFQFYLV
jgi:hypothetical protein